MKSEHRRELHTNELVRLAGNLGKFFEKHGSKVLMGFVGVAVVGAGAWFFLSRMGKDIEEGTKSLINAETAEKFADAADQPELAGTKLGAIARLRSAELTLSNGIRLYFTSRKAGLDDLKLAKEGFETVLEFGKLPNWARERALYGRAVVTETMWDGKSNDPKKAYGELLREFPESIFKKEAETALARLKTPNVAMLYAFLSTDDRKPSDIKSPFGSSLLGSRGLPKGHPAVTTPEKPVELPGIPPDLDIDEGDGTKPAPFPKIGAKKTTGPELKPPAVSAPKPKKSKTKKSKTKKSKTKK